VGKRKAGRNHALRCIELQNAELRIDRNSMLAHWDCGQQLGLADAKLALLELWLEVGCYMAQKGDVTDYQHQGQDGNPNSSRMTHKFILNQFLRNDAIDHNFVLKCQTSTA